MSKQIQFRRGTATEHATFTGAIGEITVDTTNKTLRVHDGETAGGTPLAKQSELPDLSTTDYVVETQLPTADNDYTWYRKYKSGWTESGMLTHVYRTTEQNVVFNFPVSYATLPTLVIQLAKIEAGAGTQTATYEYTVPHTITATSFQIKTSSWGTSWYAYGMIAG